MWDEYIKLRQNNFQLVKNNHDTFYKVIHNDDEVPITENVIRWFNNGFFLTRDEFFFERESRDGVDLSYTEYAFRLYNNELTKVFSETSGDSKQFDYLSDFIGDYLVIKGGVVDKEGNEFVPFKFTQGEAKHRLLLKVPIENSSIENKCINLSTSLTYDARKTNFINIDYTNNFINFLRKEVFEVNEIIYHFLLRRYSYQMGETFGKKPKDELIPYSDKEFILSKYDLTYLITEIHKRLSLDESLTINYWDRYNTHYSYKKIEADLESYFLSTDFDILQSRKTRLNEMIEKFEFKNFSFERFKKICTDKENIFKVASPFIKGRKVYIQEFQTFESNLTKKSSNLQRIPCIYISPADFLDKVKFQNFHLVQDADNLIKFYVVASKAINLDLILYSYDDYLELLKLNK